MGICFSGKVCRGENRSVESRNIFHLENLKNFLVVFLLLSKGKPAVKKIVGQISCKKEHETKDLIFNS